MSESNKKPTKKTVRSNTSGSSKRSNASANNTKATPAAGTARKNSSSKQGTPAKKSTASGRMTELEKKGYITRNAPEVRGRSLRQKDPNAEAKRDDIIIIVVTLVCVLMFLSYLGICGIVGTGINAFIFGLFGRLGYILPFIVWVLTIFFIANKDNGVSPLGVIYAVLLTAVLGALVQLAVGGYIEEVGLLDYFGNSSLNYEGEFATYGGLLGGIFVKLLVPFVGKVAAVLILTALLLILFVLMTGKPFIMAVIRKIERRIENFRKRRAIEKSEQDFYDGADDSLNEPETRHTTMRYGVRQIPGRRMGTREVSFGKKTDRENPLDNAETSRKPSYTENGDSKSLHKPEQKKKEQKRDSAVSSSLKENKEATQNKTESIYIPGVGSVRLGANPNLDVREEEYTEKDFEEARAEIERERAAKLKKETSRKSDMLEDNSKITQVGVKKLHSGSIGRDINGNGSKIIGIHESDDSSEKSSFEDTYAAFGASYTDESTAAVFKSDGSDSHDEGIITEIADSGIKKDSDENLIAILSGKVKFDQDRQTPEQANGEDTSAAEQIFGQETGERKVQENTSNIISISNAGGYSGDAEIAKSVNEILDEDKNDADNAAAREDNRRIREVTSEEIKAADAKAASEQYANVTRIGSGAASFSDESKVAQMMNAEPDMQEYKFPPIEFLKKGKAQQKDDGAKREELENTIQKLQSTFESFGVGVKVTDASVGPTVTRYELLPDQGVKVKTITSLSDDIKLALAAAEIRIEAPIPGKAAVGIEVPNKESAPVLFGDLIDSEEFKKSKTNLAFAVGKDISGKNIVSDIGDMPHALIAGATGSGKSVCINALIMSILYKAKPTEVKMIMVDPKRVELVGYNGIPHLIVPVVTDVKKAAGALAWAVAEMDDRYKRFADAGVRDLKGFNKLMQENYEEEGNHGDSPDKLPQIVIIVDELNDLMMTANSKEVEADISRLTQLARACGIHVILATQRPSVNVITGTIKANIPTRIAFAVSSIVDSRTILDQAGAEKLLGKGDMLFYPRGCNKPVRLQGVYVSDDEVNKVVQFIKEQYKEMKYNELVSSHIDANASGNKDNKEDNTQAADANANDALFVECGRYIIEKQKSSVGALQRVFKIGFNRAARIMDQLCEAGVVGPEEGTKARTILMSKEEFEAFVSSMN